ncbi:MAG TPA: hypothetical protein VFT71_02980, partial [Candidatus Nitrosocosmicus sp.]|nr:hypothetical protein [Candidatus Nitrosocosmicus sp.]
MIKRLAILSMFITLILAWGTSVTTNSVIGQTNTSNTTATGDSGSAAKMHIAEALKALQSDDTSGATMHLYVASNSTTGSAKMHIDEALKALQSDDTSGATM